MKYVIIGWALILVIFLVVLSQIPIGKEPLTELYFENHISLPSDIKLNQEYEFVFTVVNLEYKPTRYSYVITIDDTVFDVGRISTIEYNASQSIPISLMIEQPFERSKVQVALVNRSEKIHFWIESLPPSSPQIS